MTDLLATFNVRQALAQRSAVGDLSAAIPTTGVALSLWLLTTQVLPQRAATRLVRVNMQVKRFMAHWQFAGDLPRAPLQPQKLAGLLFRERAGVTARFRAFVGKFTSLIAFMMSTLGIATQLATDRGLVASKQSGNLRDVMLGFHKAMNLISLKLAEVFVIHRVNSTCRSGDLERQTSPAYLSRLVNLALRT